MNEDLYLFFISVVGAFLAGMVLSGMLVWFLMRRSGSPTGRSNPAPAGDEVLRISADPSAERLLLFINGRPVRQIDSIADRDMRESIRGLMHLLENEAEPAAPSPEPSASTPSVTLADASPISRPPTPISPAALTPPAPQSVIAAKPDASGGPLPDSDAASVTSSDLPNLPDEEITGSFFDRLKNSLTPINTPPPPVVKPLVPAPRRGARSVPAEPEPPSMFQQIDAILQKKLRAYPNAPDMLIYEDAGELCIRVGNAIYHSFEDVADEQARALIRQSVAEWEAG